MQVHKVFKDKVTENLMFHHWLFRSWFTFSHLYLPHWWYTWQTMWFVCCFLSSISFLCVSLLKHKGERGHIFTEEQERAIVNMVLANNPMHLREIQANILDDTAFNNVPQVSLSILAKVLKMNQTLLTACKKFWKSKSPAEWICAGKWCKQYSSLHT